MMTWTEEGEIFAESQGSFAPETLNPEGGTDVWSRRFVSADKLVDVSAAPTIPQAELYSEGFDYSTYPGPYEVTIITEIRDAGDEGGDTSDYEYEDLLDAPVPYAHARAAAEAYVRHFNPERDLA